MRRPDHTPQPPDLCFEPVALIPSDRCPYETYARLRAGAPAYRSADGEFWALSRFEDVRAASRDWKAFSNSDGVDLDGLGQLVFGAGDFLDLDPPEHDELRAVVKWRFTPKDAAGLTPLIRTHSDELLERLAAMKTGDAVENLAWAMPFGVMCSIFGFGSGDRERLSRPYRAVMQRQPDTMTIPSPARQPRRCGTTSCPKRGNVAGGRART